MAKEKKIAVNGQTEREQWEEQQFLNGFRQIKEHKSDSPQGQAWQRGFNDGTEFINKDLASQFEEPSGDEIIKAPENGEDPFDAADPSKVAAE